MKKLLLVTALSLACGGVFAQAPAGVLQKPSAETNPIAATGKAGDKAQVKVDTRTSGMTAMDANGDGMISRREYDRHNAMMWNKGKNKNGMMTNTDAQAMMRGGPG